VGQNANKDNGMSELRQHSMYGDDKDAKRLKQMAESFADDITLRHLQVPSLTLHDVVLDIGAGPSATLGDKILEQGASYVAVDINPASVAAQEAAGHTAIRASADELSIADNSVTAFNARFSLSWLSEEQRLAAWDEILRVGQHDARGVVTDYDWEVTNNLSPEAKEFETLTGQLQKALRQLGFEPGYGARVIDDVRAKLSDRVGTAGFTNTTSRETMRADSPDAKRAITEEVARNVVKALHQAGGMAGLDAAIRADFLQQAQTIEEQLQIVSEADAQHFVLPDVVSIRFALDAQLKHTELALPSTDQDDDVPVVYKTSGSRDTGLTRASRKLFTSVYVARNYVDPSTGVTGELLNERTDPTSLRFRSDIFSVLNEAKQPVCTVRLIHPTEDDPASIPVARKLAKSYGEIPIQDMPEGVKIGEISAFASIAQSSLATIRSVVALMESASDAQMDYVLFGAVNGKPYDRFKALFGDSVKHIDVDGQPATLMVKGPGYVAAGIELRASYLRTDSFLQDMLHYYLAGRGDQSNARQVIELCTTLLARRGDSRA
jgi:ubiquinone/menaquinone biosynthesis C-methylase UbiE